MPTDAGGNATLIPLKLSASHLSMSSPALSSTASFSSATRPAKLAAGPLFPCEAATSPSISNRPSVTGACNAPL